MQGFRTGTGAGKSWAVHVDPPSRGADVMHYMITGHLLGGRSLEGVSVQDATDSKFGRIQDRRARDLARSLEEVRADRVWLDECAPKVGRTRVWQPRKTRLTVEIERAKNARL